MDTTLDPDTELPAGDEPASELEDGTHAALARERDEFRDGWMRAKADFTNYKRLEAERVTSAITLGLADLLGDLLRVADSFTLALGALEAGSPAEQGVRLIQSQLEDVLRQHGVERIAIQPGAAFDPAVAEAMGTVPSGEAEGTVASVLQAGYRFGGRVLRPARVYLAAAHAPDPAPTQ